MKKLLVFLIAIVFCFALFACTPTTDDAIMVYMPDGAPALAMAKLMHDDAEIDGKKVKYTVVDASTIASYLTSDKADFAIVPTNVAANLFNKGKDYRLAAAVTHGNLYIVGKTDVEGSTITEKLEGLKGKKVGVIGQAGTPAMMFKYIMSEFDILHNVFENNDSIKADEISVRYCSDGAEAIRELKLGTIDFALLGEPAVSGALKNIENSSIAFDLCDIWAEITDGDGLYPQACLVVKSNVDTALVDAIIDTMKQGEEWAEQNPTEALDAISTHMLEGTATTITTLSADTISRCNIKIIDDCKTAVNFYLEAIMSIDSDAVGGSVPAQDSDFYIK